MEHGSVSLKKGKDGTVDRPNCWQTDFASSRLKRGSGYNTNAVTPGAQTEPPGGCGAGEGTGWRQGLTGRFCSNAEVGMLTDELSRSSLIIHPLASVLPPRFSLDVERTRGIFPNLVYALRDISRAI